MRPRGAEQGSTSWGEAVFGAGVWNKVGEGEEGGKESKAGREEGAGKEKKKTKPKISELFPLNFFRRSK